MTSVYGIVAGIDVHKKWLYVVIAPEEGSPSQWERLRTGSTATELSGLADGHGRWGDGLTVTPGGFSRVSPK